MILVNIFETVNMGSLGSKSWDKMFFTWLLWPKRRGREAPAGAGEGERKSFSPRTSEEKNHGSEVFGPLGHGGIL